MKFQISTSVFVNRFMPVAQTINSNNKDSQEIYSNALIKVNEDSIVFIGANPTTRIVIDLPVTDDIKVAETGNILINASLLSNFLRTVNADRMLFELRDDQSLIIATDNGAYKLPTLSDQASNYPNWDMTSVDNSFEVDPASLYKLIKHTTYASAKTDSADEVLTGIQMNFNKDGIICYGTDKFIFSKAQTDIQSEGLTDEVSVVVPSDVLSKLSTIIFKTKSLELQTTYNLLKILNKDAHMEYDIRLLNNNYPLANKVIEKVLGSTSFSFNVNMRDTYEALKRVYVLLKNSEKVSYARIQVTKDNEVYLSANVSKEKLATSNFQGQIADDDFTFSFNPEYLMNILKQSYSSQDNITFTFGKDGLSPMSIQCDSSQDLDKQVQLVAAIREYGKN